MKCRNNYCQSPNFCAVVEPDTHRVIGLKCLNCGARYTIEDVEIKKKLEFDRRCGWNSVMWKVGTRKE